MPIDHQEDFARLAFHESLQKDDKEFHVQFAHRRQTKLEPHPFPDKLLRDPPTPEAKIQSVLLWILV